MNNLLCWKSLTRIKKEVQVCLHVFFDDEAQRNSRWFRGKGVRGEGEKNLRRTNAPFHLYKRHLTLRKIQTTNIAKLVSKAWKDLTPEEKDEWEGQARRDKARFEVEKSLYTGPWKVPAKKRSQKDPNAPKRPMSAFLAYSHAKRAEVKKKSPNMNNAEISRVLAQLWKDAPEEEKKEHIEKEYQLRQKYLSEIAVWRENTEKEFNEQRKNREDIAMKTVAARSSAREDDRHDPSNTYEQDGDSDKGTGKYSGYYPSHHLYYAPNAPSQGPYGQEYPPSYPPPSYYHPAPNQHATAEHYEQPRSETAGSQDGYNDYYAQRGYGHYPPTGNNSDPYPPGGHEQYPSRGYGGSYAGTCCLFRYLPQLLPCNTSPALLVPSFQSIRWRQRLGTRGEMQLLLMVAITISILIQHNGMGMEGTVVTNILTSLRRIISTRQLTGSPWAETKGRLLRQLNLVAESLVWSGDVNIRGWIVM